MNREMMRASRKLGKKMMKLPPNPFDEMMFGEIMNICGKYKRIPDRVWKNNHFVVQLFRKERHILGKLMDKVMIRRNDAEPIREWHCLQEIKNQIVGENGTAIQVFPPQNELVDVANMYWLFIEPGIL